MEEFNEKVTKVCTEVQSLMDEKLMSLSKKDIEEIRMINESMEFYLLSRQLERAYKESIYLKEFLEKVEKK